MRTVFLDTSFLLALELSRDQNHPPAIEFWQRGLVDIDTLVTTSFVFNEVVTYLNSRGHHDKAVQVGNALLQSPMIDFIHVQAELFDAGWMYLQTHHDKTYSLTDCISFLIMKERTLAEAITFDSHFEQAGFAILPGTKY